MIAFNTTFDIEVSHEFDTTPEDQFSEPEDALEVRRQLASGNYLAWCEITVRARTVINNRTYTGTVILGANSFAGEDETYRETIEELKIEASDKLSERITQEIEAATELLKFLETHTNV